MEAGPTRHDADVATAQRALLDALGSTPLTRAELLEQVEARRQLKLEAFRRALDAGTIIRSGAGTKVDPHRYTRADDSVHGSQVPAYTREPEFSQSLFSEKSNVSTTDCGSQVPIVPEVPREPQSEPRVRVRL